MEEIKNLKAEAYDLVREVESLELHKKKLIESINQLGQKIYILEKENKERNEN